MAQLAVCDHWPAGGRRPLTVSLTSSALHLQHRAQSLAQAGAEQACGC